MNGPLERPAADLQRASRNGAERRGPILSRIDWLLLVVAAIVGIASAIYLVTDGFRRASAVSEAQRWESHTLQVMVTAEEARSAIRNMQRGERGFLLTRDERYLQPYVEGRSVVQSRVRQLGELVRDNHEQSATLKRLTLLIGAIEDRLSMHIGETRAGRTTAALSSFRTGRGEELIRTADREIDSLVQVEKGLLAQRRRTLAEAESAASHNRLALSVLGIAALCAVLWLLFRALEAARVIEFERERASLAEQLVSRDAQLAEQLEELNALYASAPIGLAFFNRDCRYLRINEELARINGRPVAEHIGRAVSEIVPDSAGTIEQTVGLVFETGQPMRDLEFAAASPVDPNFLRYWLTGFYPVKNERGEVEAVGVWVLEISERKKAQERETLLAREVDHRAKNLLAIVQAVVQLTQATGSDELKEAIIGRIQALARAHSLLAESRWDGAQLDLLVREELEPFLTGSDARASVEGPSLMLRPAAAQSLGMVLHELATNAVKYGSLSTSEGRLAVRWERNADSLEIHWSERDGPLVTAPRSSGFGSKIIRASIERQLHGELTQDWSPEGFQCRIRIRAHEALGAGESQA